MSDYARVALANFNTALESFRFKSRKDLNDFFVFDNEVSAFFGGVQAVRVLN